MNLIDKQEELSFITTAKVLYQEDGVDCFSDAELILFLRFNDKTKTLLDKGRGLSRLGETLSWRKSMNLEGLANADFSKEESTGVLQFYGKAFSYPNLLG
jgi:hypothetical protein